MIADDEPIVVEGLRDGIDWKQYNIEVVGCAYNGIQAEEVCRKELPDIIITDIKMPGADGLDFLFSVRHIVPHARFIIVSAFELFSYAKTAIELNVQAYLVKPVRSSVIVNTVLQAVQSIQNDRNHPGFQPAEQENAAGYDMIEKAKKYIDEHIYQEISLGDVAEYVNLSSSYFSRLFKKETGTAFVDYIKVCKVEKAKILLATTNKKVYEIAQDLGYQSIRYFIAVFKACQGETPQAYRIKYTRKTLERFDVRLYPSALDQSSLCAVPGRTDRGREELLPALPVPGIG
jgi:two-component system response regulator YesN